MENKNKKILPSKSKGQRINAEHNLNTFFVNRIKSKLKTDLNRQLEMKNKNRGNIIRNIPHLSSCKSIIITIIILFVVFIPILSNIEYISKIKLKIKGIGYKYVFCPAQDFNINYHPDKVYINGLLQDSVNNFYLFNQSENDVDLVWYNKIDDSEFMFASCIDITEIDFSEFNSSSIINMHYMFTDCISLTKINFTNFDTSQVTQMFDMFRNCSSLTSLDLSMFNTKKAKNIVAMFKDCISLTSLNLSTFYTYGIREIYNMFAGCTSLTSLDLSNWDISRVNDVRSMFENCYNLEYINFNNSNSNRFSYFDKFLLNVPDNIVICAPENNKILNKLKNSNCYIRDCSNDWKLRQKKIIPDSDICVESCDNNDLYQYEYNGKCVENCTNGFFLDEKTNKKKCKCEKEKCFLCPQVALNFDLCTKCNIDYYQKENDSSNLGEYINCYKEPKGYYLDYNASLYKKCYDSCETCKVKGNNITHNCLSCSKDFQISLNFTNYFNCYQRCKYYYYFDKENNYHCTFNLSCPNNYPKLIQDKYECVKADEIIQTTEIINKTINIKNIIDNMLNIENKTITKEEENKLYNSLLKTVEESFTNENYDTSKLDSGKDEIIEMSKMTITLTTTQNLKNNVNNNNMTIIDLKECETLLKNFYGISHNESLYMKKIDVKQENMKIPKIDYAVYYKLNGTNLIRLNLSICDNSTISLSVPVEINENLDKLNSSSGYFNDKCYSSTSDRGTDITLKDRKTEFVEGNKTVCQENCAFYDYDGDYKIANCSCKVKESNTSFEDMNIDRNKIYESFRGGNNNNGMTNLGITSCNVLNSLENITSNVGFYCLLIIEVMLIAILIIFCTKGYKLLENKFDEVIYNRFEKENKPKKKKIKKTILNTLQNPIKKTAKAKNKKLARNKTISKKETQFNFINNKSIGNINLEHVDTKKEGRKYKTPIPEIQIKPDTDYEFNCLSYENALKFDNRTNCEYYCSLIKSKQLFIFTFCSFNDYNSKVIKRFMFFLSLAFHYTVNALFFNDSNIHQIYEDEGKFNFSYQIPFIISSAAIATIALRLMLQFLILTDKDVLEVKIQKTKIDAFNLKEKKLKCLKIKFMIFFILNFILIGLFWYYLTCFNAIYKNTQIYLIENTFISFAFSLFYPFIINIIPTVMRMNSIHTIKNDKECLYKASQIVQVI